MTRSRGPSVLVTGAAGALGTVLCRALPELGWAVRGLDVQRPPLPDEDSYVGSVEDPQLVDRALGGVDAVIHLGGIANPGAAWADYLTVNIDGTHTVLEAARTAGVSRVVLASSNHAVGYAGRRNNLPGDVAARPDSLYGVSKAAMEALGAFYADEFGLETINLRIGSCLPHPLDERHLATWLSYPDFIRLIAAAVTAPWRGHATIWGVSANTRGWWSLVEGRRIGYDPQDDAEVFSASVAIVSGDAGAEVPYVGGARPPFPASS